MVVKALVVFVAMVCGQWAALSQAQSSSEGMNANTTISDFIPSTFSAMGSVSVVVSSTLDVTNTTVVLYTSKSSAVLVSTPTMGLIPSSSMVPTMGLIPSSSVVPTVEFMPSSSVVPTVEFMPSSSVVPTVEFMPSSSVVPTVEFMPSSSVVPTTELIPSSSVVPTPVVTGSSMSISMVLTSTMASSMAPLTSTTTTVSPVASPAVTTTASPAASSTTTSSSTSSTTSSPSTSSTTTSSSTSSTTSISSTAASTIGPIVGGVVGGTLGVIVVLILFIGLFLFLKRNRRGKVTLTAGSVESLDRVELPLLQGVKATDQFVPISDFPAHVKKLHQGANRGFEEEFGSISTAPLGPYEVSSLPCNVPKNRFENIYPYDSSRVLLTPIPNMEGSDYINASYVDGYGKQKCYIATQGPLPNTIVDFWRMMWDKRYPTIVMLTELIEGGKVKCERYWPEHVNESWDVGHNLRVTLLEQKPFVEYRLKILTVTDISSPTASPLRINHYHFTVWPDHGVPADKTCMIQFIKRVRNIHPYSDPNPLVIHCSAGVGRTGTFILLDSMLERMKKETSLDVYQMVCTIRKQRPLLVQADVQYIFIHDALDEYITCGDTSVPVNKMADAITQLRKPKGDTTGFKAFFKLLDEVSQSPTPHNFTDAQAEYNVSKNRYPDKLPLNSTRVRLKTKATKGTDYINATYVDGYKLPKACIATQAPLESTTEDFWRMVVEVQSKVIVMLCDLTENDKESSFRYWPDAAGKLVEYGKLKVKLLHEEQTDDDYTLRKLEISSDNRSSMSGGTDIVTVTQFHYTHWPEEGKPSNNSSVLKIMEALIKVQITTGNKAIIVMCNDGIGRTGAFICTYAQLERIKTEAVSDVFQFIKSSRLQRPGLVTHLEHYVFCHEVLDSYVKSFGDYSNFQ